MAGGPIVVVVFAAVAVVVVVTADDDDDDAAAAACDDDDGNTDNVDDVDGADADAVFDMLLVASVSGTRCGVRLEMGGRIGLVGHWYSGISAEGTLREKELWLLLLCVS